MRKQWLIYQILICVLLYLSLSACSSKASNIVPGTDIQSDRTNSLETASTILSSVTTQTTHAKTNIPSESTSGNIVVNVSCELKVSYIDVGQADSILIQNGSSSMLIDAGNNGDANTVVNYIKQQGISKLDYVIGTHPHEDHIGSMDAVIKTFDIGKVYMPKVTTTTKTFEDVIKSIKNKGLSITTPISGSTFILGDAQCTILAPIKDKYDDLNNYSIVIKVVYGKTSFLFTGDAQTESEKEILLNVFDLHADVLKVGHHGSDTSTSLEFLKAIAPKYAVISVGKDNDYGHPKQITLDNLANAGVQVFRTDESGTIVATSDGETIKFDKSSSAINPQTPPKTETNSTTKDTEIVTAKKNTNGNDNEIVYVSESGTKYHVDGCRFLSTSKIPIKLFEAIKKGFTPCSVCNPPQ